MPYWTSAAGTWKATINMTEEPTKTRNRLTGFRLTRRLIIAGLIAIVCLTIAAVVLLQFQKKPNLNNITVITKDVGRHYLLPTNEQPALATITDKSKLTSGLFVHAQNGDKVLIYQTNKVAIIYRPSIDRIIAVGPVAIDTPPNGQAAPSN